MKKYPYFTIFIIVFILLFPIVWKEHFLDTLLSFVSAPEEDTEDSLTEEASADRSPEEIIEEEPLPEEPEEELPPEFTLIDEGYWEDALFIGDSRMIGLAEYTSLGNAQVFAKNGLSTFTVFQKQNAMPSAQPYLKDMLEQNVYGKVYIMLGLNEIGSNYSTIQEKYLELIRTICELQPDALIFLCANMHVTASRSATDKTFNNTNINRLNEFLLQVAEENGYFYIDVNEVYDDAEGTLDASLTYDGIHVRAAHYQQWNDWLKTKGILLPGMTYTPATPPEPAKAMFEGGLPPLGDTDPEGDGIPEDLLLSDE